MKKIIFNRLNWMGFILFLIPIAQNYAQCIPSIGTAADFTIFSTVGALSNVNSSNIEGNIGTNAGTITGFTTSTITGNTHNADAITQNAANDLLSAYVAFQNLPATISSHAPAFGGGETLLAGIYHISGAGSIAGIVNLDAQNNTNAKFIIKVGGAFTIGANSIIVLNNGAQTNNVYWIVEGAFTLAANCIFKGTIISGAAIDVAVNNQLNCKLLTVNGAISTYGTQLSITGITNSYPLYYADLDQDGYGNITTFSCDYITGYVLDASDCDDTDGTVHPNAEEIYGNNIDDNCNGITDTDTSSCGETTTWNGTLWSNGIPTYAKAAVFTSSYTSAADLYACSIWITNAATVILNTNLFVYGSITVDPGSYLTQNNNKNILQIDPSVMNTGAIQVKRNTSTLVRLDHTLWSSPVSFQNIYNFSPDTLPYRIYTYDTTTDSYLSSTLSNSSVFNIAQGYAIRAPNNQSSTVPAEWEGNFIGTPNN